MGESFEHLESAWKVAWAVAKRRLERPGVSELPLPNIACAIELIVGELFEQVEKVQK